MATAPPRPALHRMFSKAAYPQGMATRGAIVEIPRWWIDALNAEIAARGLTRTDLAELLIKAGMFGRPSAAALNSARVRVTRFFDGITTAEVATAFISALGLPPFEFVAESRAQAEAMSLAASDPHGFARAVAAGKLMIELESGERRLDELLASQTVVIDSTDGDDGRGSGGRGAGSKDSRRQRR